MLIQPTLDTLNRLKLHGMALALSEQMTHNAAQGLAFEERLALLLDREALHRENNRMTRLLQLAQLKYREAVIEDLDYRSRSGLDRSQIASLASCDWIRANQSILIQGATGVRENLPRLCPGASGLPPRLECVVRTRAASVRGVQPLPCRWQLPQAPRRDRQDQQS